MALKGIKLENLPRSTRIMICLVMVCGITAAFYYFYLKAPLEQRAALRVEVSQLEASVAQTTAVANQLNRFKGELAQLEARLVELQKILPSAKETPLVLRNVQNMAVSSNLKITKFAPQSVIPREFYSDWPILMDVEGSYDALGSFFEKISQATRIINVDGITIKGIENSSDLTRTLNATYTATTFVFREDQVIAPNQLGRTTAKPDSGKK